MRVCVLNLVNLHTLHNRSTAVGQFLYLGAHTVNLTGRELAHQARAAAARGIS